MRFRRAWVAALTTAGVVLCAHEARANDPAAAQALFDQAQALMTQQRWSEACPKLDESQRLDPGGGTLLHLAACREHEGKTATAWAIYQDALASAKRDGRKDRAKIAQGRIDVLGPRLCRLRVRVAPADKKLSSFRVMRDDTPIGAALWGDPFPVDPGSHVISASADGYKRWTTTIDVPDKGGETNVEVPELDIDPSAPPIEPTPKPPEEPKPARSEDATRGDSQRIVGLAMGGVGLAGLIAGGIFGGLAFSRTGTANDNCEAPDFRRCNAAGVDAGNQSRTFGNVSTVAFIAGGAFALGGAAIYLTAPDNGPSAHIVPAVGPGVAGVSFGGRF